ncbi:hydantoinase/oxoprolinase family protein [Paremcibacter congregatus]|uniref:Hydantoinase A n=1 Tax=Paremcibacter congregatus TaxID=2043170 RepID=A0A2G4YT15_9PROT|nr:hydantoinase/oxoprolinase family protein [Paremcibacter congregatus]PHZ84596.1 hydantoinase A [Paremcibacter congregatus]QDE28817.1 hydantoinase/oxoprolinase family protein [Paremcibacter congregatus]
MMKYALAIDIGGTFTDVVLIRSDGSSWTDKTLTTHHDLLEGFFRAAGLALGRAGIELKDVDDVVVHATTVVTNVLIERKGDVTAMIVTEGFRDVLYIRDEHRYDMFDPQIEYPDPLITRDVTWGVKERIYADGTVGQDVDEAAVREVAREMMAKKVVSVAVCLLNSYCNPANEQEIRRILNDEAPEIYVTLSSDVAPQMREYLRASTTAVNAYAVPITRPYLNALIEKLKETGITNEPLIMLSNGGVIGARVAGTFPVRMIESGPAAGALVAGHIARKYGFDNLISFDMGGTTAKACLIQDGSPLVVGDFEVDRQYLFKPGSGMPVTVPSIDMIEIGAGGGSIARVDSLGLLKVGPDSAGSNPGPACYGRGGTSACVTDADVVLSILDPDNFLNGDMKLDITKSEQAIQQLADKLDLSLRETAWGIFSVVGESMAAAARAHATDRGINYRGLPLLAFGGAGPVHACYVADRLESTQVIYPPMASVLSAFGTLVTPARLDLVRGGLSKLKDLDWSGIVRTIETMLLEGEAALMEAGITREAVAYEFAADMRYSGQQTEVTVSLESDPRDTRDPDLFRNRFEQQYAALYGVCLDDMDVEVVNWRVTAHGGNTGREVNIKLPDSPADAKSTRAVYLEDRAVDVPVYDRRALAAGQEIEGPVIIEERETTAFILPGWTMSVHTDGSLIATKQEQGDQ